MNSRISYADMDDGGAIGNHGWSAYLYLGFQQTLPHEWRISANGYGMTKQVALQGMYPGWTGYGLTVSKSWMKKRLNVSLSANDFLRHYEKYTTTTRSDAFVMKSWSKADYRRKCVTCTRSLSRLSDHYHQRLKTEEGKPEETLAPYVKLLVDTSRFISSRIKDGTMVLVDKEIVGNLNFTKYEEE